MLVALLSASAIGLFGPLMLGSIVDRVVQGRPADSITLPVVVLLFVAIGQGVLTAAGFSLVAGLGETLLADLREQVVDRALRLPLERIEAAGSGDLAARIGGDVSVIANSVRNVFPTLAGSILTIAMTVVGLAALDWRFAVAGLCASPIQITTMFWYLKRSTPLYARERVLDAERGQKLLDAVEGSRTVRAFGMQAAQTQVVEERSRIAMDYSFLVLLLRTRFFARVNFAEFVGLGAILITGFFLVRSDLASVGATTAAALFFHRIFDPVSNVLLNFDEGQKAASGLARLVGIAGLPAPVAQEPPRLSSPSISARGLSFAYSPGQNVLAGVDLDVGAGERVALVGASGAGKTTLAKLLAGIHAPDHGEIRFGGLSLSERRGEIAGRVVALISQEVHVFAGMLADDLRMARPDASDVDLILALQQVGASAWVDALPQGMATIVGEGAYRLTASEAQLLALARLVLTGSPIAILDEATAEAGSAGARLLERSAEAAIRGRTAIVVAHRLTQARRADRIVMMDEGRIIEMGTHEELLALNGRYAQLWTAWSYQRDRVAQNDAAGPGVAGSAASV